MFMCVNFMQIISFTFWILLSDMCKSIAYLYNPRKFNLSLNAASLRVSIFLIWIFGAKYFFKSCINSRWTFSPSYLCYSCIITTYFHTDIVHNTALAILIQGIFLWSFTWPFLAKKSIYNCKKLLQVIFKG